MFFHFWFMYLLHHLYLFFLHLKYLIQDCFTSRYLCGKFLKACMADNFFYYYPLFEWQFGQIENSWFKFFTQYFENITPFFISSSVLIPFHVPCFFILEINSKFCHSFKFSIHVSLSPMPWNSMDPSNLFFFNLFWITLIFQVFLSHCF